MPTTRPSPLNPPDAEARALAQSLIQTARFGALATLNPDSGAPAISRIATQPGPDGHPVTLISRLAAHFRALQTDPRAALLLGEPGDKGDPLTHPRLSLNITAELIENGAEDHTLRAQWLRLQPKAKLYIDLPDFRFLRLRMDSALLNAGFGRAYHLSAAELSG